MKRTQALSFCLIVILLSLLVAGTAKATTVSDIQFLLRGSECFYGEGDTYDSELFLDEYHGDPCGFSGRILADGYSWANFEIRDASMTMTACELLSDDSYHVSDMWNPDIAKGTFASGAVLTITGSIWETVYDSSGQTILSSTKIFDTGSVLEALVNANFVAEEGQGITRMNAINFQQHYTLTGGELITGDVTGLVMGSQIISDTTLYFCSQGDDDGPVSDFQEDIFCRAPSAIQMYTIPEPATCLILALGGFFLTKRNNK